MSTTMPSDNKTSLASLLGLAPYELRWKTFIIRSLLALSAILTGSAVIGTIGSIHVAQLPGLVPAVVSPILPECWIPGISLFASTPESITNNISNSPAGCSIIARFSKDVTQVGDAMLWASQFELDILNAQITTPNRLPGYEAIEPHLKSIQDQGIDVLYQSGVGYSTLKQLQSSTLGGIKKVFSSVGRTYFANPRSSSYMLSPQSFDSPLRHQRAIRYDMLMVFTDQIIADTESYLKGRWWHYLDAAVATFEQAIKNVETVTHSQWSDGSYYDKQTCLRKLWLLECTAHDFNKTYDSTINMHMRKLRGHLAYAGTLHRSMLNDCRNAKQAVQAMKAQQAKIKEASWSDTFDTILDCAEDFETYVLWFREQVRTGTKIA